MRRFTGVALLLAVLGTAGLSSLSVHAQTPGFQSADTNANNHVSLSELLRVIQFFNSDGYHCAAAPDATEDGYVPGANPDARGCTPHDSDYGPQDWEISLSELLQLIQIINTSGYRVACGTEGGFAPSPGEGEGEGASEGEDIPDGLIPIAAGWFEMGRPDMGNMLVLDVYLSAYAIGKYTVTNQEYADILNWAHGRSHLTDNIGQPYTGGAIYAHGRNLAVTTTSTPEGSQIIYENGVFTVRSREGHNGQLFSMADHPMVMVSWYGAAMYCNWLSESQGRTPVYNTSTWAADFSKDGYHLPTEAQWERAAAWDPAQQRQYRYGNGSDSISCATANFFWNGSFCNPLGLTSRPYTSPVGNYAGVTSPAGAYDMAGNVWEWCNDWWQQTYTVDCVRDPSGTSTGTHRAIRGGSWNYFDGSSRAAQRDWFFPGNGSFRLGFRLCLSVSPGS